MGTQYAVFIRFVAEDLSFTLSSAQLPNARTWLPYAQAPAVTGAVPPVTYSGLAGTLPPGFGVDPNTGDIAGLTSAPGEYLATYTAQDAFRSRTAQIPLTVIDSPLLLMTDATPLFDSAGLPVLLAY